VKLPLRSVQRIAGKVTPDMYDLGVRHLLVMPHLFSDSTFMVYAPNRYTRIVYAGPNTIIDRIELDPEEATI
jgi:hypothetical protein